ncbi:MAG: hypothetical protein JSU63_00335 [Phycisphaerales bacterium]|nr:MAG: hypothetical protein JSU63_00335 [Phycisphaerales bacterium]
MRRSFVMVGFLALGLFLWSGCAAKKGVCGCKTIAKQGPCTCKGDCKCKKPGETQCKCEKPCKCKKGDKPCGCKQACNCKKQCKCKKGDKPCGCKKAGKSDATTGVPPCQKAPGEYADFGEPAKLAKSDTTCLGKLLANPDKFEGKYVRVAGKVESVCKKSGGALRLATCGGEKNVLVKFMCPAEGRLIPMEAVGKRAWIEGTVKIDSENTPMISAPSARIAGLNSGS